jgi:FkbM family methyltransferase
VAVPARLVTFFRYAWEVSAVAPSLTGRLRFVLATCWLLARVYVPSLPAWPVRVPVLRRGRRLSVVLGQYPDIEVLRELYLSDEYPEDLGVRDPEVIVDLGANVGLALLDFRLRYPDARLIGVEPDPIAFKTLRLNTADDPNIQVLPIAVGGSDGIRTFYSSAESVVSGFKRTRDFQRALPVVTRSLDSLMSDLGLPRVDILKIDVEGAEEEVLGGCKRLAEIGAIVGELHTGVINIAADDFYRRYLPDFEVRSTHLGERCTFVARRYTAALA